MSEQTSPQDFQPSAADLDTGVRFPPGLGLIPPRELTRVPRPRRGGELAA